MTLGLLKSLLKNGDIFVQCDGLSNDDASAMGLSEDRVMCALKAHGLVEVVVKKPFEMNSEKGTMTVLTAIAKQT